MVLFHASKKRNKETKNENGNKKTKGGNIKHQGWFVRLNSSRHHQEVIPKAYSSISWIRTLIHFVPSIFEIHLKVWLVITAFRQVMFSISKANVKG